MLTLPDIEFLFLRHGGPQYSGEPVTQLEHALQTAHLAEQSGAGDALVTAGLLQADRRTSPLAHDLERAARCSLPAASADFDSA